MIDIHDVTFIIPVRVESNDRYRNVFSSVYYLLKNTNAQVIIMESDREQRVPGILKVISTIRKDSFDNRLKYIFEYTADSTFHRTRMLNVMLMESKTPIVVNYDCDVVLPIDSYVKAAEMCRGEYDLVYPFAFGDNRQIRVTSTWSEIEHFLQTSNFEILKGFLWRAEYGFCQFFKRQSYIDGFMENENFMAYGPEDSERAIRWEKLGFKLGRVNDMVYHLEHSRTENSSGANPFMKPNEDLFHKLRNMNSEELRAYYESQEYYQKYKKD